MTKHSTLIGGSSAKRRIHCTGSAALEAQFQEREERSSWSEEGDALHALMYRALDTGEVPARNQPYTWTDPETGDDVELSTDVINEKFWPALNAILTLMKEHEITDFDLECTHAHPQTCGPEVFGTLDFVGRSKRGHVLIADFKFGSGIREFAKENYQLAFYAVGLWEARDELIEGVEDFVFAIIQPWRGEDDVTSVVDTWHTNMWWVENYRQLERTAYKRIKSKETALKSGEWCQFCRAQAICTERNQNLENFANRAPAPALHGNLDTETLATLLDMGEKAAKQFKALEAYATRMMFDEGVKIPGWKVIASQGNRRYRDEEAAHMAATRVIGTAATKTEALSPAQMEKAFKRAGADFSVMQAHIERPERGPRLVRDSNPAPEITAARDIELPSNIVPLPIPKKAKNK